MRCFKYIRRHILYPQDALEHLIISIFLILLGLSIRISTTLIVYFAEYFFHNLKSLQPAQKQFFEGSVLTIKNILVVVALILFYTLLLFFNVLLDLILRHKRVLVPKTEEPRELERKILPQNYLSSII